MDCLKRGLLEKVLSHIVVHALLIIKKYVSWWNYHQILLSYTLIG